MEQPTLPPATLIGGIAATAALEYQVKAMGARLDRMDRGLYGDTDNMAPGVVSDIQAIRRELEAIRRENSYWRIVQALIFLALLYISVVQ